MNLLKHILKGNPFESRVEHNRQTTAVGIPEDRLNLDLADGEYYGLAMFHIGSMDQDEYAKLIQSWRATARIPEADDAVDEIVNEACVIDGNELITLNWADEAPVTDKLKHTFEEEWANVRQLLDMSHTLDDIFRQGYIDGALYIENVYDKEDSTQGVVELNLLPPQRVRMVFEGDKRKYVYDPSPTQKDGLNQFFNKHQYKDKLFVFDDTTLTFVHMGTWNETRTLPISHIDRAVKVSNQLAMMEDAMVVYRIVRAPERRVFYIDVGKMPKTQAEEYVKRLSDKYRNSKIYDSGTGEISAKKAQFAAIEDFWMPRREGKGTEIQTLDGGQMLGETDDVAYFKKKLYKSLKVPTSRLSEETTFHSQMGEITREEIRFFKFVQKLRTRFNDLFYDIMRKNLILKGKISPDQWKEISDYFSFEWNSDNQFFELRELDALNRRMNILDTVSDYIPGEEKVFFSKDWVYRNVLRFSEQQIKAMEDQIKIEKGSIDTGEEESFDDPSSDEQTL